MRVGLLIIAAVNSVALGVSANTLYSFDALRQVLDKQMPDFSVKGSFSAIKPFIGQHPMFRSHRSWLLPFIERLETRQRDDLQAAVTSARAQFLKVATP